MEFLKLAKIEPEQKRERLILSSQNSSAALSLLHHGTEDSPLPEGVYFVCSNIKHDCVLATFRERESLLGVHLKVT